MMALPSSPPLIGEDPPSSPPLLPTISSIAFAGNAGRKRPHSDYGSLSSDPLFSEDTSELDFQDVSEQPRRKRMVKGPWWSVGRRQGQNLRKSMVKKEGLRNADSGVWMGSDDSMESLPSDNGRIEHVMREEATKQRRLIGLSDDDPEAFAAKVVQGCLENGKESIDLSGIGLTHISNATLNPLHQMIKHVHDDLTQPPSEDLFAPLTPSLELYLSSNSLTSLPSELFQLKNITVLSLRNNGLQEIPPHITQFPKLAELNIAGNHLASLPWEMLGMLRSTADVCQVSLRPNPFRVPKLATNDELPADTNTDSHSDQGIGVSKLFQQLEANFLSGRRTLNGGDEDATPKKKRNSREQLVFIAPSRILYMDSDGSAMRPQLAVSGGENAWEAPVLEPQHPPITEASRAAPSLFELALRSAQLSYDLRDVTNTLPRDTPPAIHSALEQAAKGVEYGNECCSTCSKSFVIHRAEWIEYWFHGHEYYDLSEEKILPFKRKACSWACAQVTPVGTAYA
ncbi:hypothetical protein Q7P37_002560 [Cladosporium fusiforme]